MINRDNFNVANLEFVKTFKPCSAFLVRLGDEYAVIKGEGADTGRTIHGYEPQNPDFVTRMNFIANNNTNDPSVKRSIDIMGKIFGYVTGDLGETFTLESRVEQELERWLTNQAQAHPEMLESRGRQQDPHQYVWYIMKAYKRLCNMMPLRNYHNRPVPPPSPEEQEEGQRIREILQAEPHHYSQLGKIVAVDTFVTNGDRYNVDWDTKTADWALQNVFVTFDKLFFRFIGVDFFDTQVARSCYLGVSWDMVKFRLENNRNNRFLLLCFEALRNKGQRQELAAMLMRGLQNDTYLPVGAAAQRAFSDGLTEGFEKLKEFYRKGIDKDRWPKGLEPRFRAFVG